MTVIEKIARVLAEADRQKWNRKAHGSQYEDESYVDRKWPSHVETAIAALSAVEEPSDEMAKAGMVAFYDLTGDGKYRSDTISLANAYRAMIQAAKAEAET